MSITVRSIHAALLKAPNNGRLTRNYDTQLNQTAAVLASAALHLGWMMPEYLNKFHLVLANLNSCSDEVIFMDQNVDVRWTPHAVKREDAKDIVAKNLMALKSEAEGGIDAAHVVVCGVEVDRTAGNMIYLLAYRRRLMEFIRDDTRWSLQDIPSKIAKLLAKTRPRNLLETLTDGPINTDYTIIASTDTLCGLLIRRKKVCAYCDAEPSKEVKFKTCSECHAVRYCSKACQVNHWMAEHKIICKAVTKATSQDSIATLTTAQFLEAYLKACIL